MFDKVLVAIDQSECSQRAVGVARGLAKLAGGTGLIVHVAPAVQENPAGVVHLETKGAVNALLSRARLALAEAGVSVSTQLRSAEIPRLVDEIVAAATEFEADVIVMGGRGDSATTTLVPGSVTHAVLRMAQTQVLVVP